MLITNQESAVALRLHTVPRAYRAYGPVNGQYYRVRMSPPSRCRGYEVNHAQTLG